MIFKNSFLQEKSEKALKTFIYNLSSGGLFWPGTGGRLPVCSHEPGLRPYPDPGSQDKDPLRHRVAQGQHIQGVQHL